MEEIVRQHFIEVRCRHGFTVTGMCSDEAINNFYSTRIHKAEMHESIFGAKEYIGQLNFWKKSEMAEFGEVLGLNEQTHLLDVGSGYGGPACYLSSVFGCRVTGVEAAESNYQIACQRLGEAGLGDKVHFIHEDVVRSAFCNKVFDAVIAIDSLVHIRDKGKLFSLISEWVKVDAKLLVAVECITEETPPSLVAARESKGAVFCETAEGYRNALRGAGFQMLLEKKYPEKRLEFSGEALAWMDMVGQREGRESMEIINRLCKLKYAEEVLFVSRRV